MGELCSRLILLFLRFAFFGFFLFLFWFLGTGSPSRFRSMLDVRRFGRLLLLHATSRCGGRRRRGPRFRSWRWMGNWCCDRRSHWPRLRFDSGNRDRLRRRRLNSGTTPAWPIVFDTGGPAERPVRIVVSRRRDGFWNICRRLNCGHNRRSCRPRSRRSNGPHEGLRGWRILPQRCEPSPL